MDKALREAMDDLEHTALGVKAERDRLLSENRALREALELVLPCHSYAINGSKGGAKGAADVEYRFNKARAFLASLDKAAK